MEILILWSVYVKLCSKSLFSFFLHTKNKDITSTSTGGEVTTNVPWTGTQLGNLVIFDGGYQITLLPGGMYMGCPCDVAKSVAEYKSFHLEFCWLEAPGKRQRLVRTYDVEGLAVSSTYFSEIKLWVAQFQCTHTFELNREWSFYPYLLAYVSEKDPNDVSIYACFYYSQ